MRKSSKTSGWIGTHPTFLLAASQACMGRILLPPDIVGRKFVVIVCGECGAIVKDILDIVEQACVQSTNLGLYLFAKVNR